MDERKLRILTIITIIKHLYHLQSKRLPEKEKVYNIRQIIYKEPLMLELRMTPEQIDKMIINIMNSRHKSQQITTNKTKKVTTPKRKRRYNISTKTIVDRSTKKKVIQDNININELVDNLKTNDNEYTREILTNTITHRINSGNNDQINTIYSLFYKSIKDNNISLLNIMIESDIDVNAQDYEGNTALHYAIYFKRINPIMILLQNDIDANLKNNQGYKAKDLITKNLVYNIKGGDKNDMLQLLEYRKNKTFKINTSLSLFGTHDNLININDEKDLTKLNNHTGILVFYMVKCGWCKKMQGDIKMLCQRGTKVYVMESKQINTDIRRKYEINGFPTIFILKNGKMIKYNGDRSYKSFEKVLK